jgi:electron transfer flavoprotein alpha subunit
VLAPGTLWGREVAARVAARTSSGLTGDAVGLGVEDGRLVAWKPAFGGSLVAAISCTSPVQMATVRPGVLALRAPRRGAAPLPVDVVTGTSRRRVEVTGTGRDDEVEVLLSARAVVAVGQGVAPEEYGTLDPLLKVLGAELGATRKVTDNGWLPRARQVGITGHSVAPALYVAVGVSGKFNHMVGARGAGTIVAVNADPEAKIMAWADVAIVGDWRQVVPLLAGALG